VWAALFEEALPDRVATLHPDTVARTRDPVSALGSGVDRGRFDRKWRFHYEMQRAIRSDQQGKILVNPIIARSGNLEDPLRVFEQGVHAKHLSAAIPVSL